MISNILFRLQFSKIYTFQEIVTRQKNSLAKKEVSFLNNFTKGWKTNQQFEVKSPH